MIYKTLSQTVSDFRTLAGGITTRLASLSGIGIVADDAAAISAFAAELDLLNSQQKDLKAQLKAKTEELYTRLEEKCTMTNIKIALPQEEWVPLGSGRSGKTALTLLHKGFRGFLRELRFAAHRCWPGLLNQHIQAK